MSEKIRPEHLRRSAYVYVRQSSPHQVRHHKEGQQRQYALASRAQQLGFSTTIVIDDDLGRSATGRQERPGFGELLTAVCEGKVGAVLALEASRLARNNRDWHHLVDLCALTEALIIDDDGIYDPRQLNDRLLLGLKGTMSEFELGLLRQRGRQAFEQKIARGHVLWEVPIGFVRTEEHRIEKIADRQVQDAIEGIFRKFRELGSARQTTLWYRDQRIPVPQVRPGTAGKEVVWQLPRGHRLNQMLKNPCYAGALVYGRTAVRTVVEDGRARQANRQRKDRADWKTFLVNNHAGYISWGEYLENQRILEANAAMREGSGRGAARGGTALLAGLLRCGRCGRKLRVAYSGTGGRVPRYVCEGGRVDRGSASCLSLGGLRLDRAVVDQVLEAVAPEGVQAALEALEGESRQRDEKRRSVELALEKARYEAARAQRQYDAVDPENRLVAGELESRWNTALAEVTELEVRLREVEQDRQELTEEQKVRLLELGADLRSLWDHPSASNELKKRILRTVLHEIVIENREEPPEHVLQLHWQGGVHTELRVSLNPTGKHRRAADGDVIELIRELSKVCSDATIAATLNRLGYRTGTGKTWRVHSIWNMRHYHRLPNYRNQNHWLTVAEAATELGVSATVVRRLIKQETLPATQVMEQAPWIIEREALSLEPVQAEVRAVQRGRKLPRTHSGQPALPWKQSTL